MTADLPLTPEDVAEIVAILDRTPYERFEIALSRYKLSVARSGSGWMQSWEWPERTEESTPAVAPDRVTSTATLPPADGEGLHAVLAPLPGTFYRAPQPGAPPFVEVGDRVGRETVIGIIETMKLMSPVHAGLTGIVVAILVDNAVAVDAQAALIRIQPDEP